MRSKLVTAALCLVFVMVLIYYTLSPVSVRCEVCVEYNGQTVCRTASGATEKEARRTAIDTACAVLTGSRTDNLRCTAQQPKSVKLL